MTGLLFLTQKTTYKRQSIYCITYLKNIIWKLLQKRRKYFVSLERMNDETLEKVSQFTYLGCSISYQFSNDAEFKLATFLKLTGTISELFLRK